MPAPFNYKAGKKVDPKKKAQALAKAKKQRPVRANNHRHAPTKIMYVRKVRHDIED